MLRVQANSVRAAGVALLALFAACNTEPDDLDKSSTLMDDIRLRSFGDCDELRDYVGDVVLETLVQYRYGGWGWDYAEADGGDDSSGGGGPSDYTTTNVQEEGVDEPDLVKSDGEYFYIAQNSELTIVDTWPAADTSVVATLSLDGYPDSLFLYNDTVVVFSYFYDDGLWTRSWGGTRMDVIDVSDRTAPTLLRTVELEGWFTDARMIDGDVYAVLNSWMDLPDGAYELIWGDLVTLPEVDWSESDEERQAAADMAREILRPYVEVLVHGMPMADLVPVWRDSLGSGDPVPMYACTDIYRPPSVSQMSMLDVVHLDLSDPTSDLDATGLMASGWVVYASTENLYVAQTSWWSWWGWDDLDLHSDIHKFEFGAGDVTYAASGRVDGWLLDQFAMSEYQGYMRVASTDFDWWWGTAEGVEEAGSRISVLEEQSGELKLVGEVTGIAPGEMIYASRMMGDKGYVVTFQQTDPLFTVDLSDPTNPEVVGELEVPGYSAYLHPMDDTHLLAVGMDGDEDGTINGLAVSVFDVSDFANPTRSAYYVIDAGDSTWSYSEALWDHHAFTFHRGVLSIPAYVYDYADGRYDWFSGLVVMAVDTDSIEELGRVDHADMVDRSDCLYDDYYGEYGDYGGCDDWYSYAWMKRGLYVEDNLYSLSDYGIRVNDLNDPSVEITEVLFHPAE